MKRSLVLTILFVFVFYLIFNFNAYLPVEYKTTFYIFLNIISLTVALTIIFGNKKIESKIAWTIFVLSVPLIGFLFYMILGVEYSRFKKFDKENLTEKDIDDMLYGPLNNYDGIMKALNDRAIIARMVNNIGSNPISDNNKIKTLNNGDVKYKHLMRDLESAKDFIHLEYFIVKEGLIFDEMLEILIRKSLSGVEVKFLYDDFGCMDLPKSIIKRMEDNGIKTACFNKINFKLFRPSINYRNHRKIAIIDNRVAYIGGINIGDEYAHMDKYYGFWRDTHLLLLGRSVVDINITFIKDWYHTTGELLYNKKYITEHIKDDYNETVQIVADGPHNNVNIIRDSYIKLINEAKERVWIVTPYLILDNELSTALKIASSSGIDVRIIVPGLHDKGKKIVYRATESFFNELLEYGVKIYKYDNQFIHSKILIIDDDIGSVGTVNFDYRSFNLHFEITAIIYSKKTVKKLIKYYEYDISNSTQVMFEMWQQRSFVQRIIESLVKIFSPLL